MIVLNVLKKVWEFIRNPKNLQFILMAAVIIILFMYLDSCNKNIHNKSLLQEEKRLAKQNYAALHDSIETYVNKAGEEGYKKAILQMTKEELKEHNPELYEDIKKESGKVVTIIKTKIEYRDTGSVKNILTKIGDDKYSLAFNYNSSDSVFSLKGRSQFYGNIEVIDSATNKCVLHITPDSTFIDDSKFKFGLTTGVKKDIDGIYRIFVTPSSSNIIITDLKGADLTDYRKQILKSKRFSFGPYIGYGIMIHQTTGQFAFGPTIGISLNYSLIRF